MLRLKPVTPESPEYWGINSALKFTAVKYDQKMSDDILDIALTLKKRVPQTFAQIKEKNPQFDDEYLLKGDEDITLIFEKGGKLTSVFLDGDDRVVENLKYSISGSKLILSNTDPSDPQNTTMDIERLTDKELVLRYDGTQSALLNPSLRKIGYSIRFATVFKKI